MFECPSCGGNLKFDIPSQKLRCEFCNALEDPYSFDKKDSDAEEQKVFEATIYTCPQCGGELLSTDNASASFCSFCGASTILHQRIRNEKRPNYIIPFKKTKEDCKQAYSELMRHAIFAPKELKDAKYIDGFRGIYMPYWSYYVSMQGPIELKVKKSHRSGDYIITDYHLLTGNLNAYHKGLSYDASSGFSDSISEALAPYDVKGMKAFTPAFFSGFYADTPDVPYGVYQPEAEHIAYEDALSKIQKQHIRNGFTLTSNLSPSVLHTKMENADNSMFPVWFMSYRNGDRVAYATVNGQTGKVVADLPVAISKYLIGSLLLAVPFFILLNMFMTVIPTMLMTIAAVIAIIVCGIYSFQVSNIAKKDAGEDDMGLLFHNDPAGLNEVRSRRIAKTKAAAPKTKSLGNTIASSMVIFYFLSFFGSVFFAVTSDASLNLAWLGIPIVSIVVAAIGLVKMGKVPLGHRKYVGILFTLISILLCALVSLFHPASDLYYYGGTILLLFAVAIMFLDIISYYNVLSTRRLPQFDKQGGDDRA